MSVRLWVGIRSVGEENSILLIDLNPRDERTLETLKEMTDWKSKTTGFRQGSDSQIEGFSYLNLFKVLSIIEGL